MSELRASDYGPLLRIRRLGKTFRVGRDHGDLEALADVSFDVHKGTVTSLVGPSGCGKTTILRIIAGLEVPTQGAVEWTNSPAKMMPTALLFQEYSRSLFPWLTVESQVRLGLGPTMDGTVATGRVRTALELTGLSEYAGLLPKQLSGGMQQRLALARSLARQPSLLLMDEPFGSLDAESRYRLEDDTLRIAANENLTVLFVTHDIDEAIYLADTVVVLSARPGRVIKELCVKLPTPRSQGATRSSQAFGKYRGELWDALRSARDP